jgi:Tfp pilus assembly protein FimT
MLQRMRGVTLVEALIVVLIAGVLLSLATPNLKSFIRKNKSTAITNQILMYLNLTRSEAAKRGYNVVLCVRNAAGTGCDATSKDFSKGVLMFVDYPTASSGGNQDYDGTTQFDLDTDGSAESAEEVILLTEPLTTTFSIEPNRAVSSTYAYPLSAIAFTPSGYVEGTRVFSVIVTNLDDSTEAGRVVINNAGRLRSCVVRNVGDSCP